MRNTISKINRITYKISGWAFIIYAEYGCFYINMPHPEYFYFITRNILPVILIIITINGILDQFYLKEQKVHKFAWIPCLIAVLFKGVSMIV